MRDKVGLSGNNGREPRLDSTEGKGIFYRRETSIYPKIWRTMDIFQLSGPSKDFKLVSVKENQVWQSRDN